MVNTFPNLESFMYATGRYLPGPVKYIIKHSGKTNR